MGKFHFWGFYPFDLSSSYGAKREWWEKCGERREEERTILLRAPSGAWLPLAHSGLADWPVQPQLRANCTRESFLWHPLANGNLRCFTAPFYCPHKQKSCVNSQWEWAHNLVNI